MPPSTRFLFAILFSVVALVACGSGDTTERAATDSGAVQTPTAADQLTAADLDALERGLRREVELVKDAQRRSGSAENAQDRGRATMETFPEHTVPLAAQAVGVPADRYRSVRETVDRVFTTLDFQGKIDGPMSVDTARADAELRARLTSDPFAELGAASAAALRDRMDRLTPIWIEYKTLTAVGG